jgi:hypothetical protein
VHLYHESGDKIAAIDQATNNKSGLQATEGRFCLVLERP